MPDYGKPYLKKMNSNRIAKDFLLTICLLFIVGTTFGQNTVIKGVVSDSVSGEKLAYVSLIIKGTTTGTMTNEDGTFSLSATTSKDTLEVSYLGYDTKLVKINRGKENHLNIKLRQSEVSLEEVTIRPKKEKYSKKENPAVKFVKQVISAEIEEKQYCHCRSGNDIFVPVRTA